MWDQTIELLTYPMIVERGRPVPNYSATPTTTPITGCEVQPGVSTELVNEAREGTAVRWTAFVRGASGLSDKSIVRYKNKVYQVEGQPLDWSGGLAHNVLFLVDWK